MRKLIYCAVMAAVLASVCALLPSYARATTFHASAGAAAAVDAIRTVETIACRLYPAWYPRRWAVYASAWPCYPYNYYSPYPYIEPYSFIRRRY
jgi:hypothetical protein